MLRECNNLRYDSIEIELSVVSPFLLELLLCLIFLFIFQS